MVKLVQLVRMSDCGSEGRGFESHISPQKEKLLIEFLFFHFPSPLTPPQHHTANRQNARLIVINH